MNRATIVAEVAAIMAQAGMEPMDFRDIRLDGKLCRFDCEGDRRNKRNGWAVVFTDGARPVATFGHWARNIHESVTVGGHSPMTAAERERMARAAEASRRERELATAMAREQAKREAKARWCESMPARPDHPYLIAKRIDAHGLRSNGPSLLVPLRDENGELHNLQMIAPTGSKRFLRGGRVKGCYASIGEPGDHFLLCEGWATGKSLHAVTGLPVAVCFSAGNLGNVATILRAKYPAARLTIAADNDEKSDGRNVGVEVAREAASLVGGHVAIPPSPGDWNDYINAAGQDVACDVVRCGDAQ